MQIEEDHMIQIREYLTMLDLIMEIDLESLPEVSKKGKLTVITQPGLRMHGMCCKGSWWN
ncbi:MAG: hypothetical protein IJI10_01125 [Eubacterium sp.]|nr:hypothetical protein [Eubacterium sp.]